MEVSVRGENATVTFDGVQVVIERRGLFLPAGQPRSAAYPLGQISGTRLTAPARRAPGRFALQLSDPRAPHPPLTVLYQRFHRGFDELAAEIARALAALGVPTPVIASVQLQPLTCPVPAYVQAAAPTVVVQVAAPAPAPAPERAAQPGDLVAQLQELIAQYRAGALTPEEFAMAKARLLNLPAEPRDTIGWAPPAAAS